jgi:2'-5' RNA ligase
VSGDARYAIYYAPGPETALWSFGSRALGYDAATGKDVPGFTLPGVSPDDWRQLTARPRNYGFHATLAAPFRLDGRTERALGDALDAFADRRKPFDLGRLQVTALGSGKGGAAFVAFTPSAPPNELAELERDVVLGFQAFRRPLTTVERERRDPERVTARQRSYLDAYGYPYVLDEFRFHMTLTDAVADSERIRRLLSEAAQRELGEFSPCIDAVCLFRQGSDNSPFSIASRHAFRI